MVQFDTINDCDMEEADQLRVHQATGQTRNFAAIHSLHRFDIPITHAPILESLKCYSSSGLIKTRVRKWLADSLRSCHDKIMEVKVASRKQKSELGQLETLLKLDKLVIFCDQVELNPQWVCLEPHYKVTKSSFRWNIYAADADGFTTLNIPSVSQQQRGITSMEIEKMVGWTGASRAKNIIEKASKRWANRSYPHKTRPVKVKNESQGNAHHILLLISTLLATITFHTALRFYLPRCISEEGYTNNSSLNSVFQIESQSSYSTRILIMFNSVAFFLSAGMMMILFNGLPLRPWLLVLVFSMIGSYICILMDPINPSSCSS